MHRVNRFAWQGTHQAAAPGLLIVLALLSAAAFSQASSSLPAFDAVSVKPFVYPNRPWNRSAQIDPQRLYIEGMAPVELIELAYSLNSNQLTGLPRWAQYSRDSLYTIAATTDKPTGKDHMLLMLRRVLAENFQLKVEVTDKVVPVWALVVPPSGPKFKPIGPDERCLSGVISRDDMKKAGAPPSSMGSFHGCSIADLVRAFNGGPNPKELGRPVIDRTGLAGRYDLTVWREFAKDDSYTGPGIRFSNVEPFREAVQKELGLKLEDASGPYRVVNVVSIARPTPGN